MKDFKHEKLFLCITFYIAILVVVGCGGSSLKKITFSQVDTVGYWKMVSLGMGGNGYGYLTVQSPGEVSGGAVTNFGVDSQEFRGGTLNLTEQGAVSGSVDTFLPDSNTFEKYVIYNGQITQDRDTIVYAGDFPVSNKGIGIIMKRGHGFNTSDLKGTWLIPLEGIFTISVNEYGAVSDCKFLAEVGIGGCNGNFSIAQDGTISGQLETVNGRNFTTNFSGQMGHSKNTMILAGDISTSFEGMATLAIKREGNFSLSDRKGNWKFFRVAPGGASYGIVVIDGSGTVTGGSWTGKGTTSGTFTGGTISVTPLGGILGYITTSAGDTYTVIDGQMGPGRELIGISDRDNSGRSGVVILVKISE